MIDVGGRYEPEKRNFDHHIPGVTKCSADLVADYLSINLKDAGEWADVLSIIDIKGLRALKAPVWLIRQFRSPIDDCIINMFGIKDRCDIFMVMILKQLGHFILTKIKYKQKYMKLLKDIIVENHVGYFPSRKPVPIRIIETHRPDVYILVWKTKDSIKAMQTCNSPAAIDFHTFNFNGIKPDWIHPNGAVISFVNATVEDVVRCIANNLKALNIGK